MGIYTAPRSRAVVYRPEAKLDSEGISKGRAKVVDRGKRLLVEQIPVSRFAFKQDIKFTMPSVQNIKWGYTREITKQYGLQSFALLPWYTKAVSLTIIGKYYMGAFATDVTSASGIADLSLERSVGDYIQDEMEKVDTLLTDTGRISRSRKGFNEDDAIVSSMSVGAPGEPNSLQLLGFIESFDVEEAVEAPFIQKYTFKYLGVNKAWYSKARAFNKIILDQEANNSLTDDLQG